MGGGELVASSGSDGVGQFQAEGRRKNKGTGVISPLLPNNGKRERGRKEKTDFTRALFWGGGERGEGGGGE